VCPFITAGTFDLKDIVLEFYSKNLVTHIMDAYKNKGVLTDLNQATSALFLGRVDAVQEGAPIPLIDIPEVGTIQLISEDPLFADNPSRIVFLIREVDLGPGGGNTNPDLPADITVTNEQGHIYVGNTGSNTIATRLVPVKEGTAIQVTSVPLKVGIEASGTAVSAEDDADKPLESGVVLALYDEGNNRDKRWDSYEIVKDGTFTVPAPRNTEFHLLIGGPQGGPYAWTNSPFTTSNFDLTDLDLEITETEVIQSAVEAFDSTFDDLTIGPDDYANIGLIGGAVERLVCDKTGCKYTDAEGVTVSVTDRDGTKIDHYVLYLHDDTWKSAATSADDSVFAILVKDQQFPLDIKILAQKKDVDNFEVKLVEARVYAYGLEAEGIFTLAPVEVTWEDPPEDDGDGDGDGGGGGGGCFIDSAAH
jgi:hypothetical protein